MDKYLKKLIKEAKNLQLKKEDKLRIRKNLYSFMRENPLPPTPALTFGQIFKKHAIAFSIVILLVSGSGISFAAEGSAPGNILYPVKKANERMLSSLILSEEFQANWELKKAERRLVEAEKLASQAELEEDKIASIENDFEEHARTINERIAELQLDNKFREAAELSSDFETSLKAHDKILTRIIKSKTNAISGAEPLAFNVRAKSNVAERARITSEDNVLSAPADEEKTDDNTIEGRTNKAENRILKIHRLLNKLSPFLAENIREKTLNQIEFVDELMMQAQDYITQGEFGKAFIILQQANRISGELEIILSAGEDVSNNIKIEKTISIKDCTGPILESFPRQCATPDGNLIIREDLEIKIPQ